MNWMYYVNESHVKGMTPYLVKQEPLVKSADV